MALTLLANDSRSDAFPSAVSEPAGPGVTFNFLEPIEGIPNSVPSVSALQQTNFMALFFREMNKLEQWAAQEKWPSHRPDLHIFVSRQYSFAQSLWPQWKGQKGRMEFPAFRVAVGEANVLHELIHIYFPNANRMLAEGLAVHLQQEIGENPSYPNFKEDLHHLVGDRLESELCKKLKDVSLCTLEQITTPSMLMLRIERGTVKGIWAYIIAGSFVRFLIETFGLDRFRILYDKTPLVPLQRNAGAPSRWKEVYELSLADLELQWKSLVGRPCDPP